MVLGVSRNRWHSWQPGPTADPTRFHDVGYQALVADPLGEIERLYARLGLALSGPARRRMRRWLHRHHHRGRGRRHRYSLTDFGLDPAAVDRRFTRYRQWVATATRHDSSSCA